MQGNVSRYHEQLFLMQGLPVKAGDGGTDNHAHGHNYRSCWMEVSTLTP
jgi:hypothetical protein